MSTILRLNTNSSETCCAAGSVGTMPPKHRLSFDLNRTRPDRTWRDKAFGGKYSPVGAIATVATFRFRRHGRS